MKISYNWLKEFLPDLDQNPEEVARTLTAHSFETQVDGHIHIDNNILVTQIQAIDAHPDADRLQLVTISVRGEDRRIVCGAPNIKVGDIVPYAPPGTKLLDENGDTFELKEATIRGQKSPGMLNSPRELGLGDWHGGIYILPPQTPLGTPLQEHIPDDTILDADITPNRAHDCLSHVGIARELAAILNIKVSEPALGALPQEEPSSWSLEINLPHDVRRYIGIPLQDVQISPSPLWMQARLWAMGARPIHNVVDITNYVMFEVGNPTHAFDAEKLPGDTIGVSWAKGSESLTTLDDQTRTLSEKNLVITCNQQPVAVAGVIGGADSEVGSNTTKIFLEVANFRSYAVQESSAALNIRTESAARFMKDISPHITQTAAARAIYLLQDLAGAKPLGTHEYYPNPQQPHTITFNPESVNRLAGTNITAAEATSILTRLRCQISGKDVTVPLERLDLLIERDLIEEVIRMYGLENISASEITFNNAKDLPRSIMLREFVRDRLIEAGMTEVYNWPFEHVPNAKTLSVSLADAVSLANPVSPEQAFLRKSMIPRLCENLRTNKGEIRRRHASESRNIFEISRIWRQGESERVSGIVEEEYAAGLLVDLFDIQNTITSIFAELELDPYTHTDIWRIENLDPRILARLKLPEHIVSFACNITALFPLIKSSFTYQPQLFENEIQYRAISRYPASYRDISLAADGTISTEKIQGIISQAAGPLAVDVDLIDEYLPPDTTERHYTFKVTYQSHEKTLSEPEIIMLHNTAVAALQQEQGITIQA